MMTPTEHLHYAIGLMAYAVAKADGMVQKEEREQFAKIVEDELRKHDEEFNVSDIIFKVMENEKFTSGQDAYDWAINEIRANKYHLDDELKITFINVMLKMAKAYPPVTAAENELIENFCKELEKIDGRLSQSN